MEYFGFILCIIYLHIASSKAGLLDSLRSNVLGGALLTDQTQNYNPQGAGFFIGQNNDRQPARQNGLLGQARPTNFGQSSVSDRFNSGLGLITQRPSTAKPGLETVDDSSKTDKQQLQDLLDRLNRLNELQKQKQNGNNTTTSKPDKGSTNKNPANTVGDVDNGSKQSKWKKLTKRKFLFQMQSVKPDDEIEVTNSTVYYVD